MVKLGIVGLGSLGTTHALNIVNNIPGAELIAVCARREQSLRQFSKKVSVKYEYTDYEKMLSNKEIDGILIVTSVNSHCDYAVQALEAGFHVFVEKPIGLTLEEAKQTQQAAEANPNSVFMTGYMRRFDPSYLEAKKKIDAGLIGDPIMFRGYSLDQDAGVESAPERGDNNGVWFTEMIVHDIDLARWFLNADVDSVSTIGGCYKHKIFEKYNDIDNACTMMSFKNNAMALFYTGRTAPHGSHVETEIIGTEGMLRINDIPRKDRITIYNNDGVLVQCAGDYLERFESAFILEITEFVSCISEKREPPMTAYDSRMVTEISLAAYQSYMSKAVVKL